MANADDPADNVVSLIPGMNRFGPRTGDYTTLDLRSLRGEIFNLVLSRYGYNPEWFAARSAQQQNAILQDIARALREEVESDPRLAVVQAALRQQLDQRDKEERKKTETSAPDPRMATGILAALSGQYGDMSGATAAWISYVQTHYTETYTTTTGIALRTTRERAELYRQMEAAFQDASPADRRRLAERVIQPAEDFFKRADQAEADQRPLTVDDRLTGARTVAEISAEWLRRIEEGRLTGPQVRQFTVLYRLATQILSRLPSDTPEAHSRRRAIVNALEALSRDVANGVVTTEQEITGRFREIINGIDGQPSATSEIERALMNELQLLMTPPTTGAWQARAAEREATEESIEGLRERAGNGDQEAIAALTAISRRLATQIVQDRGQVPDARAIAERMARDEDVRRDVWQSYQLAEQLRLLNLTREAMGLPPLPNAGAVTVPPAPPQAAPSPGDPPQAGQAPVGSPPGGQAASEPTRPATQPATPPESDPQTGPG